MLNQTVTWLLGGHHHHHHEFRQGNETGQLSSVSHPGGDNRPSPPENEPKEPEDEAKDRHDHPPHPRADPVPVCCSDDPAGDLQNLHNMAAEIENFEATQDHQWEGNQQNRSQESDDDDEARNNHQDHSAENENKKLMRMSLNTALAIGLHNFPEGLATFVAALSDPSVGAVLAVAIAIHNVPEGLCVAMPVYYATGNKLKAFGWAVLSGIAEPIAALLGWAALANSFSDQSYAILFGLVSGMMVIISARELLPTAHRYDPEDSVVTYSFMIGMAIMAISLVLFLM